MPAATSATPAESGMARLIHADCIALAAIAAPATSATTPTTVHTRKYAAAIVHTSAGTCGSARAIAALLNVISIGIDDGSIIAIIIASHMAVNIAAAITQS